MQPIIIATIRQYRDEGYTLTAFCTPCSFSKPIDLAGLCAKGFGDRLMRRYRPKCPKCGERLQFVVQPPGGPGSGGRPEFLIRQS